MSHLSAAGKLAGQHDVFTVADTGAYRVFIPPAESDIEIDVPGMVHPIVKRHLDWPLHGDLDLGEMVIEENLTKLERVRSTNHDRSSKSH